MLRTAARVCSGVKSRSRPAISKLAARRLTSHSQGPGRVSSKSLTSNTRRRSGAAKTPKFERWASPQSLHLEPRLRSLVEVHRHDRRRAAIERERRGEHPPVADRNQFGDTVLGLVLEHLDRILAGFAAGSQSPWLSREAFLRAALPAAARSSGEARVSTEWGSRGYILDPGAPRAGVKPGISPDETLLVWPRAGPSRGLPTRCR